MDAGHHLPFLHRGKVAGEARESVFASPARGRGPWAQGAVWQTEPMPNANARALRRSQTEAERRLWTLLRRK